MELPSMHDLVVYRLLDLRCRNRNIFKLSENIGELHADKFDIFLTRPLL